MASDIFKILNSFYEITALLKAQSSIKAAGLFQNGNYKTLKIYT